MGLTVEYQEVLGEFGKTQQQYEPDILFLDTESRPVGEEEHQCYAQCGHAGFRRGHLQR